MTRAKNTIELSRDKAVAIAREIAGPDNFQALVQRGQRRKLVEIAKDAGVTVSAVSHRIRRARERLEQHGLSQVIPGSS